MSEVDYSNISFSIIKNYNSPNSAVTEDGIEVRRKEKIYIPDWNAEVKTAPYDNHFIYYDSSEKVGRWSLMCSCSSPAGIIGYNAYKKDASNYGAMIICLAHGQYGKHSDGSS